MYTIRCKSCNDELTVSTPNRGQSCKCPNRAYLRLDNQGLPVIVAEDMGQVQMVSGFTNPKPKQKPIEQNVMPKRRIRKLEYEVR